MTLDQYVTRYRLLQRTLEQDERMAELIDQSAYAAFLRRFAKSNSPALAPYLLTRELMAERIEKRGRLCLRYAERLARAITLIQSPVLRRHARFRYLFGMTHEDIARESFISLRSVYRQEERAKAAMTEAMLAVKPRLKRCPPGRFLCEGAVPRRSYAISRAERVYARCRSAENAALHRDLKIVI